MIEQIRNAIEPLRNYFMKFGISFTVETLITAFVIGLVAIVFKNILNRVINRGVARRGGDKHAAVTAKKVTGYVVYSLTVLIILGVFGIPMSAIGASIGLIGLGISFALKDMISNFISGMMILINRPFKIGDQIKVEGESGTVKDVRIRATDVKTFDGRKIIVPNSKLYNGTVENLTYYDERRFEVVVGVGYDDDIKRAKEIAENVLQEADGVIESPSPDVLVTELGGSSVNLKLRGWTTPTRSNMVHVASDITSMIKNRYDDEGIDIPYPIRTVFMHDEE